MGYYVDDIQIFQVFGNSLAFKSSFSDCFSEFLWKPSCCQLQKVRISIFIWVLDISSYYVLILFNHGIVSIGNALFQLVTICYSCREVKLMK